MTVTVKDIMLDNPITIQNDKSVGDAVELFAKHDIGCLPVVDANKKVVGFLSDGDIIEYVVRNVSKRNLAMGQVRSWVQIDCFNQYLKEVIGDPVYDCATSRVISIESNASVKEASRLFKRKHLKQVPVIDNGKLIGLLSRRSIMRGMFTDYLKFPDAPCVEGEQEDDF